LVLKASAAAPTPSSACANSTWYIWNTASNAAQLGGKHGAAASYTLGSSASSERSPDSSAPTHKSSSNTSSSRIYFFGGGGGFFEGLWVLV
jgi:hypothetical protein